MKGEHVDAGMPKSSQFLAAPLVSSTHGRGSTEASAAGPSTSGLLCPSGPATILRDDKLRAIRRRQQKARAVDRARRFLATWGPHWYSRLRSQPHVSKRFAVTPKPCSCFVCGNRRKVEGPSISERRRIVEALS